MQTTLEDEAAGSAPHRHSGDRSPAATERSPSASNETQIAEWPPIPKLDDLQASGRVNVLKKQKTDFADTDLSLEAAGFVGSDGLSVLFGRWIGWLFCVLCAGYFVAYAAAYGTRWIDAGLEPSDGLLVFWVLTYAIPAACAVVGLFLGIYGHGHITTKVAGFAMGLQALFFLGAWMIPAIMESEVELAVESAVKAVMGVGIAWTFMFKEAWWLYLGCCIVPVFYVTTAVLAGGFGFLHALHMLPPTTIYFGMIVFLLGRRMQSLRNATLAMKEDERRYNEAWDPVVAENKEALVRLTDLTNKVKNERVLQPFDSLGAIYKRAALLNDWYQAVVKHWADACGVQFHAAPIKAQKRAREKVHRSYNGDFRRVLDILRSTIVVEDIGDVAKVFHMVASQAHVHQVKNRFDPDFDSKLTAGYRDLNCQLTFRQLDHTDFEGFVFELQVHYTGILALKSNEGHKRYIKLRNLRGD